MFKALKKLYVLIDTLVNILKSTKEKEALPFLESIFKFYVDINY